MDQVVRTCQRPELSARSSGNLLQSLPQAKNEFKPRPKAFYNNMSQLTRSLPWVFLIVLCFKALDPADAILWLSAPDEQTGVEQRSPFNLHWDYKMDDNERFLSSEMKCLEKYPSTLASRHSDETTYKKHPENACCKRENCSYSVLGENNVTLTVNSAHAHGYDTTYCCEVVSKLVGEKKEDRRCSKVFIYAEPRITYHTPRLSCKQGDCINLQCNATGIPTPRVKWIHDDTLQRIGSSSHILLNITGRRSGGRYCCNADNGFGRDTACTAVNVTEYEPDGTTLLVNQMSFNIIYTKCTADASPPSRYFIMTIDGKEYNSSNGVKTFKVATQGKNRRDQIAVSCIPFNKYGQGPIKKDVFPVYALPRFKTTIRTKYNMTVNGITLQCNTTGVPTPNITWTSGDTGEIVGTGKYHKVPYVKCVTKTMMYFCHARNVMGNITSPAIHVNVMTERNCSTADKGLDQSTPNSKVEWIKATIISCFLYCSVLFVMIIIKILQKRKMAGAKKDAASTNGINYDLDIYQEGLDAVVEREESQPLARSTSFTDNGDEIFKECCITPNRNFSHATTVENNDPYQEQIDAVVVEREESQSLERSTSFTDDGPYDTCVPRGVENEVPYHEQRDAVDPAREDYGPLQEAPSLPMRVRDVGQPESVVSGQGET